MDSQTVADASSTRRSLESSSFIPRIALAGTPNSGKTTLFNILTGLRYKVANYPGVTVERREAELDIPGFGKAQLVDLPGIYTLFGHSIDEIIAARYLFGEPDSKLKGGISRPPDLIVAVVDASNLERGLYLATQLIDLGTPFLLAVNMIDVGERRGITVRAELLSRELGVPVVLLVAQKKTGISQFQQVLPQLLASKANGGEGRAKFSWCPSAEFRDIAHEIGVLQRKQQLGNSDGRPLGTASGGLIATIGVGLLSGDITPADATVGVRVEEARKELQSKGIDASQFEAEHRYRMIESVVRRAVAFTSEQIRDRTEAIDKILTNKFSGSIIFILIMWLIFQSVFTVASYPMELLDTLMTGFSRVVSGFLPAGRIRSLLVDGVIAGVGSVLIFIPQIAILYFSIGLLEDSGYLSRAAFLMDKIMRRFGLQGRSFIPLLSSFACAIPGIMSTRVIPSFSDRLATILVAPLMSCSARLPVYTLLIAAFVPNRYLFGFFSLQGLVLLSMYLLGIIGAACMAWLFKKTLLKGLPSYFVMEMPPYHLPSPIYALRNVWDRIVLFVKDAGTVILACSIVLWFLASHPLTEQGEQPPLRESYAGTLGKAIEPIITPLGYDWRIGVGILASFAAREVFVSSLATVYNLEAEDGESESLIAALRSTGQDNGSPTARYTVATALSLMVFYCFACQCMSTLAVCRRETGSWKWPALMFGYMTVLAYVLALVTYKGATSFLAL